MAPYWDAEVLPILNAAPVIRVIGVLEELRRRHRDASAQQDLTMRYASLMRHYGMEPSRNNAGKANENGSIESAHGHLKQALLDALLLRGTRDFPDLQSYRAFLDKIIGRRNENRRKRITLRNL